MKLRKSKEPQLKRPGIAARLLRDQTLHFFVVAAALLLGHRLVAGNPRTIVITPALHADLERRLHDQLSRPPTGAEFEEHLRLWKRDEAIYREALREGIDRDDLTVRTVLINKMRERALLQTRTPDPTEANLQQFLEEHRDMFAASPVYEHEYVALPKSERLSAGKLEEYSRQLTGGATPAALGLRSVAAIVNKERIEQEF